ncbi:unnamed protein product [Linum tenue]|uniref:Transmembrane protein n=1 Tax=Linum tenue TaxID=586396 RepID=A0AAV0KEG7_9ROSI|nr:unnamed protein product [Linum tenue]
MAAMNIKAPPRLVSYALLLFLIFLVFFVVTVEPARNYEGKKKAFWELAVLKMEVGVHPSIPDHHGRMDHGR